MYVSWVGCRLKKPASLLIVSNLVCDMQRSNFSFATSIPTVIIIINLIHSGIRTISWAYVHVSIRTGVDKMTRRNRHPGRPELLLRL